MVEVGDILLCTVEKISGTVVFVKLPDGKEGSIILSEIAPGRIRNLREYVFPGKNIVCKVLRVNGERIDLSLRRVTPKETKELRESLNIEKSLAEMIKNVLKEDAEKAIKKIKEESDLHSFFEDAKTNPKSLEKIIGKENSEKIIDILNSQKKKSTIVKKTFTLKSYASDGIKQIKKILSKFPETKILYIAAGKYSISYESEDKKLADQKITEVLNEISDISKKEGIEFSQK